MPTNGKPKTKKKPKPKREQMHIEGLEPLRIPPLDETSASYVQALSDFKEASASMNRLKSQLIDLMKEHKLVSYTSKYGDEINFSQEDTLKVKKAKANAAVE